MNRFLPLFILMASCSTDTSVSVGVGTVETSQNSGIVSAKNSASINSPLIGAALDEQERSVMEQTSPRTLDRMDRNEPLTINDVIKLSQGGVSDQTMILYMKQTESEYSLTQSQLRRLHDAGVSDRVIDFMVQSRKTSS